MPMRLPELCGSFQPGNQNRQGMKFKPLLGSCGWGLELPLVVRHCHLSDTCVCPAPPEPRWRGGCLRSCLHSSLERWQPGIVLVAEVLVVEPESGPGLLSFSQQADRIRSLALGVGGPGWCEPGQAPDLLGASVSLFVR